MCSSVQAAKPQRFNRFNAIHVFNVLWPVRSYPSKRRCASALASAHVVPNEHSARHTDEALATSQMLSSSTICAQSLHDGRSGHWSHFHVRDAARQSRWQRLRLCLCASTSSRAEGQSRISHIVRCDVRVHVWCGWAALFAHLCGAASRTRTGSRRSQAPPRLSSRRPRGAHACRARLLVA